MRGEWQLLEALLAVSNCSLRQEARHQLEGRTGRRSRRFEEKV